MATNVAERSHSVETLSRSADLTVTNAVWIAAALLHKRYPMRDGFSRDEIVAQVMEHNLTDAREGSIHQHVRQHSVANKKPQPNTVCMLFDIGGGLRRLFRAGDEIYPGRNPARTHPKWEELPPQYEYLKRWHEEVWNGVNAGEETDPLLALVGTWKGETADVFVAKLREGWEGRR
jgi:hypothetical protein